MILSFFTTRMTSLEVVTKFRGLPWSFRTYEDILELLQRKGAQVTGVFARMESRWKVAHEDIQLDPFFVDENVYFCIYLYICMHMCLNVYTVRM